MHKHSDGNNTNTVSYATCCTVLRYGVNAGVCSPDVCEVTVNASYVGSM